MYMYMYITFTTSLKQCTSKVKSTDVLIFYWMFCYAWSKTAFLLICKRLSTWTSTDMYIGLEEKRHKRAMLIFTRDVKVLVGIQCVVGCVVIRTCMVSVVETIPGLASNHLHVSSILCTQLILYHGL